MPNPAPVGGLRELTVVRAYWFASAGRPANIPADAVAADGSGHVLVDLSRFRAPVPFSCPRWLPEMAEDGVLAGPDWTPDLNGPEIAPLSLLHELQRAMPQEMVNAYELRLEEEMSFEDYQ